MRKIDNLRNCFSLFCMGFFALFAQTLIFRSFLSSFNGNELSIGFFFFSWLIWVCIGAYIAKIRIISKLSKYFPYLLLIYLPAFLLQSYLLDNVNTLLGLPAYEVISLGKIITLTVGFNAPVCFFSGFLFVLGTAWIKEKESIPVIHVYILESLGSFAGALSVTILLYSGFVFLSIFWFGALLIILSSITAQYENLNKKSAVVGRTALTILFFFCIILYINNFTHTWTKRKNADNWYTLLPNSEYKGSFTTPQAKYYYGDYKGQFSVISWNSTYDSFPNIENSSEITAEYLAQNPNADQVLTIGQGVLSVCNKFAELSEIKDIYRLDTDPQYSKKIEEILPDRFKPVSNKIQNINADIRQFVKNKENKKFDLIVIEFPKPTSLHLNRYYSKEFFSGLKNLLSENGVIGISFPGGKNYLGSELTFIGSSIYYTLKQVFGNNIILKPGRTSRFFVSDSQNKPRLSENPKVLAKRLKKLDDLQKISYDPENIYKAFEKNRISFQMNKYNNLIDNINKDYLLNTDINPKFFLYSLLYSIKKISSVSFNYNTLFNILNITFPFFVVLLIVYLLLSNLYTKFREAQNNVTTSTTPSQEQTSYKGVLFLVFAAAIFGIGINMVLMLLFQINYGSIFIYFGIITSLFMLGLTIGGISTKWILSKFQSVKNFLTCITILSIAFISWVFIFTTTKNILLFTIAFILAGTLCGTYFPFAAFIFKKQKFSDIKSGSTLELLDNFGGAIGAIITPLILLPIIGIKYTLLLLILLILVIRFQFHTFTFKKIKSYINKNTEKIYKFFRVCGYILFGISILFIFFYISINKDYKKSISEPSGKWKLSQKQINSLCKNPSDIKKLSKNTQEGKIAYYRVKDKNKKGYIYRTEDLVKNVRGFGGPISIYAYINQKGKFLDFIVGENNETTLYLNKALRNKTKYLKKLEKGKLHTVTGATHTSSAISKTLKKSRDRFQTLLGKEDYTASKFLPEKFSNLSSYLSVLIILILICAVLTFRRNISILKKNLLLVSSIILVGLYLNMGVSTNFLFHILSTLKNFNIYSLLSPFLIIFILIIITITFFGNIYCGYICPFGALQELISKSSGFLQRSLFSRSSKQNHFYSGECWKFISKTKYIILFLLIILFCITNKQSLNNFDVLNGFFIWNFPAALIKIFAVSLLILAIFFGRLWCRVLCPVGALFSFFNIIHKIKKSYWKIYPEKCNFGINDRSEIDCLYCDNCHINIKAQKEKLPYFYSISLAIIAVILGFSVIYSLVNTYYSEHKKPLKEQSLKTEKADKKAKDLQAEEKGKKKTKILESTGKPHNINADKYRNLINRDKLSGHKAKHYREIKEE